MNQHTRWDAYVCQVTVLAYWALTNTLDPLYLALKNKLPKCLFSLKTKRFLLFAKYKTKGTTV